jgi:hypothetical protein
MPAATLDRPIRQRVKIYQWRSESKCRTKCVHTLARKRGSRGAFEALALDAHFRGHDEQSSIPYPNFSGEVLTPLRRGFE